MPLDFNPSRTDFTAKSWLSSNSKGNISTTTSSITTIDTPLERSFYCTSNREKYNVKPFQTRKLHCPEWSSRKSRVVNPKRKPIVLGLWSSYEDRSFASRQLVFLPLFAATFEWPYAYSIAMQCATSRSRPTLVDRPTEKIGRSRRVRSLRTAVTTSFLLWFSKQRYLRLDHEETFSTTCYLWRSVEK